jgi:MFS family permease
VAEIDGSIVMATHPLIASEFNDLSNSTWLITAFALAGAVTQPLVRHCGASHAVPG